jgi:bisphosphoglycerate-independent phosphoglycerate mutase (AlkP superfamily)
MIARLGPRLALGLVLGLAGMAPGGGRAQDTPSDVAAIAAGAAADLQAAIAAMQEATGARDRVAALTLLELMGLPQPPEMTGRSLITR